MDAGGVSHGFLYNTVFETWTSLDDPSAGSGSGQGTATERISGTRIVGAYYDTDNVLHGFLYDTSVNNWTTLDAPLAGSGGTIAYNISATNIVGIYVDNNNVNHGFLLSGTNWTTLDDPLAGSGSNQGTYAGGIEGANIVGLYLDANGVSHGFLATPIPQLAITQSSSALTVTWPYWNNLLTGWSLQQSPDLSTINWTPGGSPSSDGTNNFITFTPAAGNLFFRLSQQ